MATLYVTEQGAVLRKTGERLVVEKDRAVLLEVPCRKLDAVLIYGNVQVTTQALAELLEHGVELAMLSAGGRLRGQLTPPKARNIPLRMRQYELAASEAACLPLAREIVRGKIANQAAVLRRFRVNHPEAVDAGEIAELDRAAAGVDRAAGLEVLRGIEGAAAARHFRALAGMVPPELRFEGRSRRPPRDPVNALLSLGYVLAGNELQSLLDAMGFDPYLGFFHRLDYGRPSLALDLVEEFRAALVDRFVTGLFNRRVFQRDDFTSTPEGGTLLRREALKRFFPAYEKELTTPLAGAGDAGAALTFRQLFRRQAERLARALQQGESYEAFRLPC